MYEIGEWSKAKKDFEIFGISIRHFYDGLLTVAYKKIVIDIVKFDGWLEKIHPDEWKITSMDNLVRRHYGEKGIIILKKLI
jgi:hypothetical protein